MVPLNLITRGLIVCIAVGLSGCEVSEEKRGNLLNKLKSSIGSGFQEGQGKGYGRDNLGQSNSMKGQTCYGKDSPCRESSTDAYVNEVMHDESMLAAGIHDLKFIYDVCRKNVMKMFRKKHEESGTEKGVLQIREKIISFYNCVKVFSFRRFDDFLTDDVVPISRYLEFVKDDHNGTERRLKHARMEHSYAVEILSKNWIDLTVERIEKLLNSHSLKFRIGNEVNQGRGRRRDHRMFAMMMMGFVIMASILVPMGFQFLTVLGGKSLLMAKMALIMSAINGLKKIATSNVGYGLYHAGPEAFHHDPHHHGFHEKIFHIKSQEQPDSPFNVVI